MFKLDSRNIKIYVYLENGIYTFDPESSTGKTRLAKLIYEYQAYREPVASYTYNDKLRGLNIESILDSNKYKLIVLDRYDLYNGYGAEQIIECAKNSIILIDCKMDLSFICDDEMCYIEMTEDKIEVRE